jgi:ribosomal protein L3
MTKVGVLCLKQDMTQLLLDNKMEAVTLLKFLPDQEIVRIKTEEKDGYNAVVIGAGKKEKDGKVEYRYMKEFKVDSVE